MQLYWPQDGNQIVGDDFTWRGRVDDFTAAISATRVDSLGNAEEFEALVERDGKFWIENIPLSEGTNRLALHVLDAAGNTANTNISVVKSALSVTIDPVPPDSLWKPSVDLAGTISEPTHAVWVNGVKGTNHGNGRWSAKTVPVTAGGTATFSLRIYSPDEQQPDGTYGNQQGRKP